MASHLLHPSNIYLMQVYDAKTRLLIGTTTSQDPTEITLHNLPGVSEDVLLFIRTMDYTSVTSDANIIYVPAVAKLNTGGKCIVVVWCWYWYWVCLYFLIYMDSVIYK